MGYSVQDLYLDEGNHCKSVKRLLKAPLYMFLTYVFVILVVTVNTIKQSTYDRSRKNYQRVTQIIYTPGCFKDDDQKRLFS